ncbi:MAG TPA: efflux RND transporter periplasmic adaptor subunit [Fimbriimonadaceae bacterium]|nr:efflux RND transporter periplasmic adaptor subunit [Fimbriimonadaceae bacterium]
MKGWVGAGVAGVALLGLVGWRWRAEAAAAEELKQEQGARRGGAATVEVARVETRPLLATVETVGTFESPFRARLSHRTAGRVDFIEVREGDQVSKGQVLVRIDPQEANAQVMQQRASVSESRARLAEAQSRLAATETEVEVQIRQEQAALTRAKADLEKVERNKDAEVATAESEVDAANAQLASAEAQKVNANAEVVAAEADFANALARHRRAVELAAKGYIADQEVENLALLVETRRANVDVKKGQRASAESAITAARARKLAAEKRVSITRQTVLTDQKLAQAAVSQAEAALAQAKANRSRTPAYRQNLRALEASVASADAELSQAAVRRADTELRSPIAGTVTERTIDPGSLATPGQALVVVESIEWLYVVASVPVESASQVSVGKDAQVRLDAFPNRIFQGKVDKVNRAADPQSRQVEVRIRLDNSTGDLRPGMFAKVSIVVGKTPGATVVPIEAIKRTSSGSTVMLVTDQDEVVERAVTTGASDRGGIEIVNGLKPGDRVVVLSYQPVKEGQKVKVAAERGKK